MKPRDFSLILRAADDLIGRRQLETLARAFDLAPGATFAAALKRIASDATLEMWDDRNGTVSALSALRPLLALTGKAGVAKNLDAVVAVLERGPVPLPGSPKKLRTTRPQTGAPEGAVDDYLRDLESSLGNAIRFPGVYDRLSNDSTLSVADLKVIAKQFAKATAKSKGDALRKIWSRHQSLLSFDAKARATDGRSAA